MTATFSGCKNLMKATDLVSRTKKTHFSLFAQKFTESFKACCATAEARTRRPLRLY